MSYIDIEDIVKLADKEKLEFLEKVIRKTIESKHRPIEDCGPQSLKNIINDLIQLLAQALSKRNIRIIELVSS